MRPPTFHTENKMVLEFGIDYEVKTGKMWRKPFILIRRLVTLVDIESSSSVQDVQGVLLSFTVQANTFFAAIAMV